MQRNPSSLLTLALFSASTLPLAEIYPEPFDISKPLTFYFYYFSSEETSFLSLPHEAKSNIAAKIVLMLFFHGFIFLLKLVNIGLA